MSQIIKIFKRFQLVLIICKWIPIFYIFTNWFHNFLKFQFFPKFRIPISNSDLIHLSLVVVGLVWKWEVTNNNSELLTLLLSSSFSYSSLLLNLFLSSSCMVSFSLIYIKIPIYVAIFFNLFNVSILYIGSLIIAFD